MSAAERASIERKFVRVIVIGAGAAGLMAGCAAADGGADVTVLDQNEKVGKKIFITGKGRCNYTNACDTADFFGNVLRNPKFLYSAVYGFDSSAMTQFLQNNGCPVKQERGQRCFPASDHAYDVTDALVRHLRAAGGRIRLGCRVKKILTEPLRVNDEITERTDPSFEAKTSKVPESETGDAARRLSGKENAASDAARRAIGVQLEDGKKLFADAVIVATGGMSYPSTGSTGDGYRFAGRLGLKVVAPQPSLVPYTVEEAWPMILQGLSLKNVAVKVEELPEELRAAGEGSDGSREAAGDLSAEEEFLREEKYQGAAAIPASKGRAGKRRKKSGPVYEGFGEMLFTHFGVSGPLILSASCHTDFAAHPEGYLLHLDLKPAMTQEEVIARLKREFGSAPGKELRHVLRSLMPQRLAEVIAELFGQQSGWDGAAPVRTMDEKKVKALALLLKNVTMHVTGTRGFPEAIITRGGVDVRQINPSTMETKSISGLYWAGEVLDVDAYTGGFNLQIAWSTGHLAGACAARQ